MAQAYVNLEKHMGGDAKSLVKLPTGPEDAEGYKAVFKALGAPDTVDGYEIRMDGASPEDLAAAKAFAAEMHAKGPFPASFVAAATEWFSKTVAEQNQALLTEASAATAAGEATLKAAWGQAFDQRKAEVGKLLNDLGGPELVKEFQGSTWGDNPQLSLFLGKVLDKMAEPGGGRENSDLPGRLMTPTQAAGKAREYEAHPAFRDKGHAQHAEIVRLRNEALAAAEAPAA